MAAMEADIEANPDSPDIEERRADLAEIKRQRGLKAVTEAKQRVDRERKIGEKLDLQGTPSFFINGKRTSGITSVDALRSYVEQERAATRGQ